MVTYVAARSVSTERVTEFIKRLPVFSNFLSVEKPAPRRTCILCAHVLAVVVGGVICGFFSKTLFPPESPSPPHFADEAAYCLLFGILASGGSSFWNSARDTLRNVKTSMAPKT